MPRRWMGRWIVAVAVIHTVFGFTAFAPVVLAMLKAGVWDSVGTDAMRGGVAWFLLSGGFMLVCGLAVDAIEEGLQTHSLRPAGWSLLVVTLITIVLMPVSGAWLLLPPAVFMIRRRDGS